MAITEIAGLASAGLARAGRGPSVLLIRCPRLEGHFLGDPLVRLTSALGALLPEVRPLVGRLGAQPGAPLPQRVRALLAISGRAAMSAVERPGRRQDPLRRSAGRLPAGVADHLAGQARGEVDRAVSAALSGMGTHA